MSSWCGICVLCDFLVSENRYLVKVGVYLLHVKFFWKLPCSFFSLTDSLFLCLERLRVQRDFRKNRFETSERMESESETSLSSQSSGISEFSDEEVSLMEPGSGNYGYLSSFFFSSPPPLFPFSPFSCSLKAYLCLWVFLVSVKFVIQILGFCVWSGAPITGGDARSEHLVAMRFSIADIAIMKQRYISIIPSQFSFFLFFFYV